MFLKKSSYMQLVGAVIAAVVLSAGSAAAQERFSAQAGASVGSFMFRFGGGAFTVNGLSYNANGSGFYELAPSHKIGGGISLNYLNSFSYDYEDWDYIGDDWEDWIYMGIGSALFAYLDFNFAPTYRFEPQSNIYVQAALNISVEVMEYSKLRGAVESRNSTYYNWFRKDTGGFDPVYTAELSGRYNFIGAYYGFILNDDFFARNIISASLYASITDKFELAPSILYRFGEDAYEQLYFTIGVNYLF